MISEHNDDREKIEMTTTCCRFIHLSFHLHGPTITFKKVNINKKQKRSSRRISKQTLSLLNLFYLIFNYLSQNQFCDFFISSLPSQNWLTNLISSLPWLRQLTLQIFLCRRCSTEPTNLRILQTFFCKFLLSSPLTHTLSPSHFPSIKELFLFVNLFDFV